MLLSRLVDEAGAFLPAGAFESFRDDLGLSYTAASAVLLALGLGSLPGTLLTSAADRYSRRVVASFGAACYAASLALFALAPGVPALVAAAVLLGIGSSGMVDGLEVALTDAVPADRLRVWLARQNLFAVGGDLAGPALLAAMAFTGAGWRWAFAVAAALVAAYGVLLACAPLPPPRADDGGGGGDARETDARETDAREGAADDEGDADDGGTILDVLRDGRVWMIGLLALATVPFDEPFFAFLIAHLQQSQGVPAGAATLVAMAGVGGGLLVHGVAARRPLRFNDHTVYTAGAVGLFGGALVVALVPFLPAVAAAAFVVGAGLDLCWLAVQHRTLTLRAGQAGRTTAVVSAIEQVGFALPLALGAVADAATTTAAMAGFAVIGAVVLVVARCARRTLG